MTPTRSPGERIVRGTVFNDLDRDTVADPGEPGVMNVKVEAIQGMWRYQRLTDASGQFVFDELEPGTWTILVDPPSGMEQSDPAGPIDVWLSTNTQLDLRFALVDLPTPTATPSHTPTATATATVPVRRLYIPLVLSQ